MKKLLAILLTLAMLVPMCGLRRKVRPARQGQSFS